MLSKREKLFAAVSDLHGLICPVCRQLLSRQGDNLICAGGHAVNVNRRGCVNLLSAQADTFCCRMRHKSCWTRAAAKAGT